MESDSSGKELRSKWGGSGGGGGSPPTTGNPGVLEHHSASPQHTRTHRVSPQSNGPWRGAVGGPFLPEVQVHF